MRTRTRRRRELEGIAMMGDVNELAISGHVEHEPVLREDDDRGHVCEFVLTHTTGWSPHWEHQRYNVRAYGELGEYYAANWQPGQAIMVNGHLEHQLCDTLAGPLPSIQIVTHNMDPDLGPHPHQPTIA